MSLFVVQPSLVEMVILNMLGVVFLVQNVKEGVDAWRDMRELRGLLKKLKRLEAERDRRR